MKYFLYILTIFILQGCLYFNDRGVSAHLYDNCHSYYDANGEFVKECDENIIDYDEAKEGVLAVKNEIYENITTPHGNINIENPSTQDQNEVLNNDQDSPKEEIELIRSHCK